MPYTTNAKNLMLNALAAQIGLVSLHSADPSTTGANELTGGSPAYARKSIAFAAASGGAIDDSTNGTLFDVPAGSTVAYVGFWSADGTTFYGSKQIVDGNGDPAPEVYAQQGNYNFTNAVLDLNS